jgi:hypothetical protein
VGQACPIPGLVMDEGIEAGRVGCAEERSGRVAFGYRSSTPVASPTSMRWPSGSRM